MLMMPYHISDLVEIVCHQSFGEDEESDQQWGDSMMQEEEEVQARVAVDVAVGLKGGNQPQLFIPGTESGFEPDFVNHV